MERLSFLELTKQRAEEKTEDPSKEKDETPELADSPEEAEAGEENHGDVGAEPADDDDDVEPPLPLNYVSLA